MRAIFPPAFLASALLMAACDAVPSAPLAPEPAVAGEIPAAPEQSFPAPDRPVSSLAVAGWEDDDNRDRDREAQQVLSVLGLKPGQSVADIGAGAGYYSVRLAPLVGKTGKVYVNDIIPDYLIRLKQRMEAQGSLNGIYVLGDPGNANLPADSVDTALMVRMYHEIAEPFSLMWHLHDSLKPGGQVAIVDVDRPTDRHGTPPALLKCEVEATGYRLLKTERLGGSTYISLFEPTTRPKPDAIRPCPAS